MSDFCIVLVRFLILYYVLIGLAESGYWEDRSNMIKTSQSKAIGSALVLTEDEEQVNEILMNHKYQAFDEGFQNPGNFLGAQHFFKAKNKISDTEIYNLIRKIPKGASLHSHDTALVSEEFLFSLTYEDNLYVSYVASNTIRLHFFNREHIPTDAAWLNVADIRKIDANFDAQLKSQLSLVVANPKQVYSDENSVWKAFKNAFTTAIPIICYKPVFEKYFYQALKELYEDNVMYLEFRTTLPEVYDIDINSTVYKGIEVAGIYKNVLDKFKMDYPEFHNAKIIYAPSRNVQNSTVEGYVKMFKELKDNFGDFIAGFDLVGEEDLGHPLADFIPSLLELKDNVKFFFHAGETNWFGESSDFNLFDAVLLNTTRIGHGYAIMKHPEIQRIVKEQEIAVEISPISNQVLDLVDDIRNHPGNFLISNGFPVVITCDDPSFWGAKGLSFDWYEAFMAMSSRESDLKLLKQLAMNSIKYSAMSENEKQSFFEQWLVDWNKFIKDNLNANVLPNVVRLP